MERDSFYQFMELQNYQTPGIIGDTSIAATDTLMSNRVPKEAEFLSDGVLNEQAEDDRIN